LSADLEQRTPSGVGPPCARIVVVVLLVVMVAAGCFGGVVSDISGPQKCQRPADGTPSFGCAVLTGSVVGPSDEPLDGISGAIRATPQCGCRGTAIVVDTTGSFTITVHRSLGEAMSPPDTATIAVYMGATATKYPRAVTGDAYFDTVSVHFTYAPIGSEAPVYNVKLRIPLPRR
jgi:hypothetical protein